MHLFVRNVAVYFNKSDSLCLTLKHFHNWHDWMVELKMQEGNTKMSNLQQKTFELILNYSISSQPHM